LIELVITVSAILVVYAVIFGIETLWRFVVSTPVNIYAQQVDRIGELTAKNSFLEHELKEPSVTAQEQRRREMVSEKVKTLGEFGRKILRCIDDQGEVNALSLHAEYNFSEVMLNNFFAKAVPTGLILYQNHVVRIKPELKSALDFVLSNEYDKDLKE